MQIYWNKRKHLQRERVELPEDWLATVSLFWNINMAAVTSCDVMYLEAAADMEMKKNVPHVSSFLRHFNNIGFLRTAKTVTVLNISAHFLISCIYFLYIISSYHWQRWCIPYIAPAVKACIRSSL